MQPQPTPLVVVTGCPTNSPGGRSGAAAMRRPPWHRGRPVVGLALAVAMIIGTVAIALAVDMDAAAAAQRIDDAVRHSVRRDKAQASLTKSLVSFLQSLQREDAEKGVEEITGGKRQWPFLDVLHRLSHAEIERFLVKVNLHHARAAGEFPEENHPSPTASPDAEVSEAAPSADSEDVVEFTLPHLPSLPHHQKVQSALYALEDAGFPLLGQHMLAVRDDADLHDREGGGEEEGGEAEDGDRMVSVHLMTLARAAGRGHPMARVALGQLWLFADRTAIQPAVWDEIDQELQRFAMSGEFAKSRDGSSHPHQAAQFGKPSRWRGMHADAQAFSQAAFRLRDIRSATLLLASAVADVHATLRALTVRAASQGARAVRPSESFGPHLPEYRIGTILGWTLPVGARQLPGLPARLDAYEEALITLTLLHFGGVNVPVFSSNQAATRVLGDLARRGHRVARLAMGYRWWRGVDGMPQDCGQAAQHYFPLATEAVGDTEAQTTDRSPNPPLWSLWEDASAAAEQSHRHETVAYLEELAGQGDLDAMVDLAWALYGGDPPAGIPQDLPHARRLFERAAAQGVAAAHSALGMMHANGLGWADNDDDDDREDDEDDEEEEEEAGIASEASDLGQAHEAEVGAAGEPRMERGEGQGGAGAGRRGGLPEFQGANAGEMRHHASYSSPDVMAHAKSHRHKGDDDDDTVDDESVAEASIRESIRSIEDLDVVDSLKLPNAARGPSMAHALRHYRIAAEMGDGVALAALGSLFLAGEVVQKNVTAGIHLLQQGAEMGDAYAHTDLGTLYLNGEVVKQDIALAKHHLGKAKQAGVAVAHYNLGIMHWNGWETGRQNCSAAVAEFRRVAERGSWRSDTLISSETAFSAATGSDMDLAVRQFAVLSAVGLSAAMEDLAFLLDHGHGKAMVGPPFGSIATRPLGKGSRAWVLEWPVSETLLEHLVPFTNIHAVAAAARSTTGGLTHSEIRLVVNPSAPRLATKLFFACEDACTAEEAARLRTVPWDLRAGEDKHSDDEASAAAMPSLWGQECASCDPASSPPFLSRAGMMQWVSERDRRWFVWRRWFLAHVLYPRGADDGVGFLTRRWGDCWRDAWPGVCDPGDASRAADLYEQAALRARNGQAALERARLLLNASHAQDRNLTSAWLWLDRAEAMDYLAPAPALAIRAQALFFWIRDSSWEGKKGVGRDLWAYAMQSIPDENENDEDEDEDEAHDVLRVVESQRRYNVGPFPLTRGVFVWLVWHVRAFAAGGLFLVLGSLAVLVGWGCCRSSGQAVDRDGVFHRH